MPCSQRRDNFHCGAFHSVIALVFPEARLGRLRMHAHGDETEITFKGTQSERQDRATCVRSAGEFGAWTGQGRLDGAMD
jgi:hypothetical protein